MKPPFRLEKSQDLYRLQDACAALAAHTSAVALGTLEIARLGRFLALRPQGPVTALNALAAACVKDLDSFRAHAGQAELARRRAAGLTPAQEANLQRWGYPYVLDGFRFHITLSGRLKDDVLENVQKALKTQLGPLLPRPFILQDLALMGEAQDGRFHLIQRYPLSS